MNKEDRRKEAASAEDKVIDAIRRSLPNKLVVRTHEKYSEVDGFTVNSDTHTVESVFEVKCRNLSMPDLMGKFKCSITIASNKLNSMQKLSEQMKIPSILYTYTMMDGCLFALQVTDKKGIWSCRRVESAEKEVPATVGGEPVVRSMSDISMAGCTIISVNGWTGAI